MRCIGSRDGAEERHLLARPVNDCLSITLHALPGAARGGRERRDLEAGAMLVHVDRMDEVGLLVPPPDAHVPGLEYLPQLVADEVDDLLEIELGGNPLLDAVDG